MSPGDFDERRKVFGHLVPAHAGRVIIVLDVETGEEDLVEHLAGPVAGDPIEILRTVQQLHERGHSSLARLQVRPVQLSELPAGAFLVFT